MLNQQLLFHAAGIYAYAYWYAALLCPFAKLLHLVVRAYVAGVYPKLVYSAFKRGYCKPVVKMYIRNQRHDSAAFKLRYGARVIHILHGKAHYFAPFVNKAPYLRGGGGYIRRARIGHGLHANLGAAAYFNIARRDLMRFFARCHIILRL